MVWGLPKCWSVAHVRTPIAVIWAKVYHRTGFVSKSIYVFASAHTCPSTIDVSLWDHVKSSVDLESYGDNDLIMLH